MSATFITQIVKKSEKLGIFKCHTIFDCVQVGTTTFSCKYVTVHEKRVHLVL